MNDLARLVEGLRAVYGEMFPRRTPQAMRLGDDVLALGVLCLREHDRLRREVESLRAIVATLTPSPRIPTTFTLRGKVLDAMARHDPADPE